MEMGAIAGVEKVNELTQNWLAAHLPCVQNHNSVKEEFQLIRWRLPDIIFFPCLATRKKTCDRFSKIILRKINISRE
jgi:hypothetical protein